MGPELILAAGYLPNCSSEEEEVDHPRHGHDVNLAPGGIGVG